MKSLIIYAHPYEQSFNANVLAKTKELLIKKGNQVDLIDLNKDGFDPVMHASDLKLFATGNFHDKLAENYVERLKKTDELILIFPIWWYGEPAILKGFYDKVLLKGHVYADNPDKSLKGLLKAKKATILTTGMINKEIFSFLGNPIENILANGILKTIGINDTIWLHCKTVHLEETRLNYLEEITNHFS